MTNDIHHGNSAGNGGYERSDISVTAVFYFFVGLAVALVVSYFIVEGLYHYLEKRNEAEQTPVSPLVANTLKDTRRIPPQYKENEYQKYLKDAFPAPQLETDERTELNDLRLREESTLSTYDYVDKNAGIVRIPIDRAMDIIAQRGLPVRSETAAAAGAKSQPQPGKGTRSEQR